MPGLGSQISEFVHGLRGSGDSIGEQVSAQIQTLLPPNPIGPPEVPPSPVEPPGSEITELVFDIRGTSPGQPTDPPGPLISGGVHLIVPPSPINPVGIEPFGQDLSLTIHQLHSDWLLT